MTEFVALGVSPEVVVVVENQHFRAATDVLDEVIGRGETAHSRPDDDQIVGFARVRCRGQVDAPAIAERMRDLE